MAKHSAHPTQEYTLEVDTELRFEIEKLDVKITVEVYKCCFFISLAFHFLIAFKHNPQNIAGKIWIRRTVWHRIGQG